MSRLTNPCLSLAVTHLTHAGVDHFAIWVLKAPYPGGYVHSDCAWTETLTQKWIAWQQMFSLQGEHHIPLEHHAALSLSPWSPELSSVQGVGYGGRLMQELGIELWNWLLNGPIRNSLAQSRGIAIGQGKPLRLRLDIRNPNLIPLPWETMQPEAGKQAIALNQQILFSRTTSDVDPLMPSVSRESLNILLVLGQEGDEFATQNHHQLQLKKEAAILERVIQQHHASEKQKSDPMVFPVSTHVTTLIQPTTAELIKTLETRDYNVLFYAGHGIPAPNGGLLFLRPDATINGTELAQVLVRTEVTLAVFNACWGAQPDREGQKTIPRSSLAEVLLHHGIPAVLGMRDLIADEEALSFIEAFTQALSERMPIDQAVAVARQRLLTLYKFNQPAWTLPILYMHPDFDGELIKPIDEGITELPTILPSNSQPACDVASVRSLSGTGHVWYIRGGLMRVGRRQENDLVIQERWVSQHHAEIICRDLPESPDGSRYFLRDFSRYGTWIGGDNNWTKIHHQEVPLDSGVQLKFGSAYGQPLEFVIEKS